ncbi:MAG: RNA polymerase factor sigma-54 [Candidatus Krumholzibacteria bacterium]|jgi:RNA polymerase sigma-54 factor|nr:RNA polymerase factor sigma-54 [Candidatus Krumholzibacteria bacterium]
MDVKMGLHQGLHLKQQIVMTQRLQQALKLLQVPTLELAQILRNELQANPLLEEVDAEDEAEEEQEQPQEETSEPAEGETAAENTADNVDWDEYFKDGFRGAATELGFDDEDQLERPPVYVPSGQEHLRNQLVLAVSDPRQREIGEYIIGCLNGDGFLAASVAEIAAYFEIDAEAVEAVLRIIQSFDPPGVAARDLPECLLLQLAAKGMADSPEAEVIKHHFDLLKTRKFADIARAMKITPQEVQAYAASIGELDPRPGLSVEAEGARAIVPDLVVEKVSEDDDHYVIYLNDGNLPRLRVSRAYDEAMQDPASRQDDAATFIDEKRRYAEWIIKTIEQRRRTMIRVMEAIVAEQRDFFERGAIALRPLTLQQVASAIGMHESTVSRVTRQKYVQTPRGVFPLKYFFSAGLDTDEGDEVAAKAVKLMIEEIVAGEDPRRPLSDKRIADLLGERGLRIARRTVAKYREQLGILNARMRKQF